MPSIQGGGGFIPQPIQPQRQVQQAAPAQAEAAQTRLDPKDSVRLQAAPTQTSLSSQVAQRLTSDGTKTQIHQLIQQAQVQVPNDKPQLQMMQRPAMSSALADMLKGHHVPEQQQLQQPSQNLQAQTFAGQMQTSTFVRAREHTKDSADRNSLQSGQRVRKDDQEGEFSSLEDFGGEGMSGGQSDQDQRSDSQKKKQILTLEEKRKPPAGAKPAQIRPPAPKPAPKAIIDGYQTSPKAPTVGPVAPKPPAAKPSIQRVQPPMQQSKPPTKNKTDEWTL